MAGTVDGDTGSNCRRRNRHDCHDHPLGASIVCVATKNGEVAVGDVAEDVQRHLWCNGSLFRTLVSLLIFLALGQLPGTVQLEGLLADFRLDVAATAMALDLEFGLGVAAEVIIAVLLRIRLTDHLRLANLVNLVEAALRITDIDSLLELGVALKGAMLALEQL